MDMGEMGTRIIIIAAILVLGDWLGEKYRQHRKRGRDGRQRDNR